jgi:hypothetical protein
MLLSFLVIRQDLVHCGRSLAELESQSCEVVPLQKGLEAEHGSNFTD